MIVGRIEINFHGTRPEYGAIPVVYSAQAQAMQKASVDNFGVKKEEPIPVNKLIDQISPSYYPGLEHYTGSRLDLKA